jgi:hypothetical protein
VKTTKKLDLDDALSLVNVTPYYALDGDAQSRCPHGWFAVENEDGIIAYFGNEHDACRFRLSEINRRLSG